MAMTSSSEPSVLPRDRRRRHREQTIDEALEHALAIMTEYGVGGLTVSEMARRMGIRGPSLYKYFPSLQAVYDLAFARGTAAQQEAVWKVIATLPRGVDRIRAGARATVAWAVANPALAQLLFWRPVPGFEPAPETFQTSVSDMDELGAEFTEAVRLGQLDHSADGIDAVRLLTVVLSGLISQQMANEPHVPYDSGVFTRLTDDAIEMFLDHYRRPGGDRANPRS
ncbi:MAG: TetR/AcrR family transcriptional regulator [Actinomycetota bacterium]|nr:TetR/AcrR family transcriptional regulator [Actinomycetota bacterium]